MWISQCTEDSYVISAPAAYICQSTGTEPPNFPPTKFSPTPLPSPPSTCAAAVPLRYRRLLPSPTSLTTVQLLLCLWHHCAATSLLRSSTSSHADQGWTTTARYIPSLSNVGISVQTVFLFCFTLNFFGFTSSCLPIPARPCATEIVCLCMSCWNLWIYFILLAYIYLFMCSILVFVLLLHVLVQLK